MTSDDFYLICNFIQNQDLLRSKSQFWRSLFNFSSALTPIRPFQHIGRLLSSHKLALGQAVFKVGRIRVYRVQMLALL